MLVFKVMEQKPLVWGQHGGLWIQRGPQVIKHAVVGEAPHGWAQGGDHRAPCSAASPCDRVPPELDRK